MGFGMEDATIGGGIINNVNRTGTITGIIGSYISHIQILYEYAVLWLLRFEYESHVNR
jgi:hypothetical protein